MSVGLDHFSERDPVTSEFEAALGRLEVAVTGEYRLPPTGLPRR
jgi:hypothetical protein